LDEKTGKSYLFFLIEDTKRIGVGRVTFFCLLQDEKICPFGFRTRYDRRKELILSLNKKESISLFLIRLVLRTAVLTQEKRMFLLHSLDSFGRFSFPVETLDLENCFRNE